MSYWLCLILIAPAFAQTSPPTVPPNFRSLPRQWSYRLYQPNPAPVPARVVMPSARPKVCSIPLLRVPIAKGNVDHMPVMRPEGTPDPKFVVPAPAPPCDDGR